VFEYRNLVYFPVVDDTRDQAVKNRYSSINLSDIKRPIDGKLVFGVLISLLFLVSLACSLPSQRVAVSLAETRAALDIKATILESQKVEFTRLAASHSEVPTTQPVSTTQPPTILTPTPTETALTPTEEPTMDPHAPVEGSLIRAPYDPAADWGTGNDVETFDGSTGIFPPSSEGAAAAWYAEGRYHISFTSRGRWTWYWAFLDASDFYADIVIINGDVCVSGDTAGMVFRGNSTLDYGYMFGISCGGQYFVGVTSVPGTSGFIWSIEDESILFGTRKLHQSDLIDTGPGAMNRIGIMARDGDFNFYINGKWVDEFSFWGFPAGALWDHGNFALYLGTAQKPDAKVSFEDFNIWYLP
jgi:hypothetical protein